MSRGRQSIISFRYSDCIRIYTENLWENWAKIGRPFPETMAIEIDRFIHDLNPDPTVGQEFSSCCHRHGIKQVIDLDVLSPSDMGLVCAGCSAEARTFAAAAQAGAKLLSRGWARGLPECGEGSLRTGRGGSVGPTANARTFYRTSHGYFKSPSNRILGSVSY